MTSSATNYYYTRSYFYLDTTPLLVVLCLTLWTGFDVVEGRVADRNCQSGFYYDPFAAVCQRCSACPPGQEPREVKASSIMGTRYNYDCWFPKLYIGRWRYFNELLRSFQFFLGASMMCGFLEITGSFKNKTPRALQLFNNYEFAI